MNAENRQEAFARRRDKLAGMTDEQLKQRFWDLCHKAVAPMVALAGTHTSPSIERSVLLRMGVDSVTAQGVVAKVHEAGLLGKGAGHVLVKLAEQNSCTLKDAAEQVNADATVLKNLFGGS